MFSFVEKVTPPDEIRISQYEVKKPRLEQREKIRIFDREFRRLKNHTELSIDESVEFVNDNLDEEDKKELKKLLSDRIVEYRKKRPVIFKKWLKENGYK